MNRSKGLPAGGGAVLPEPAAEAPTEADALLARVEAPRPDRDAAPPALRTARLVRLGEGGAEITWRGASAPLPASVDPDVDRALLERAAAAGDAVLVEVARGEAPVIVGVVQTRLPDTLELRAGKVVIEADREVVIRSGRAALRLREDGEVELVGSRILTLSRGLFRIVGRALRLN